jgi:hypothetical protein
MCSLAAVMLLLMCDDVSNTDVGSFFSFCYIIIIAANNFKFFRPYISSLYLVRLLLPVGVEGLQSNDHA